jgi:hypothetical protein
MTFTPKDWRDRDPTTPLSAAALKDLEQRVHDAAVTDAETASDPAGAAAAAQATAIAASSQGLTPTAVKSGAYTAAAGDFVPVDASGGTVTVTLPAAPADRARIGVKIVAQAATPNTVTISRGGSDVFNKAGGSTALSLNALFQGIIVQYASSTGIWYVQSLDAATGNAGGAASLGSDGKHKASEIPAAISAGAAAGATALQSFQGRTATAATLTKADVTGTGLAAADVGADASGAAATEQTRALAAEATKAALTQVPQNVVTKTAAYTAAAGDAVMANATSGAFTITLPAATTAGQRVLVKKTDASANAVTVAGTIDGTTNASLAYQNQSIELISDGTAWQRVVRMAGSALVDYGTANGVGTLDSTGRQPVAQAPLSVVNGPFAPSGFTGATAASRYVGATTSGAPVAGTFAKGDWVIDQSGIIWVCTTAGTPGTWTAIQPNTELGYAQITSSFTTTSGTAVDVTGLTTTVTVGARPIRIEVGGQYLQNNTAGDGLLLYIVEDGTVVAQQEVGFGSANETYGVALNARRNPAAGSHTYKVQLQMVIGGTAKLGAAATAPAYIQVVQV